MTTIYLILFIFFITDVYRARLYNHQYKKNANIPNETEPIRTLMNSNNFNKSLPSLSGKQHWRINESYIKTKSISTLTHLNNSNKSLPSFSEKQHPCVKNAKNISNETEPIRTLMNSNNFNKSLPSLSGKQHWRINESYIKTKSISTLTDLNNSNKLLPSFSEKQHPCVKNAKNISNETEPIRTLTYSNDFNKSLPSLSEKQHRRIQSAKDIDGGTKVALPLSYNNDNNGMDDSNNSNKLQLSFPEKQLTGVVAYGIYRPRPYYRILERHFRVQNGYDDGYLIKIFEDYDYVILTQFVKIDTVDSLVISPPPGANVIIVNQKDFLGGENNIHMIELDHLYEIKQKSLLKEKAGEGIIL